MLLTNTVDESNAGGRSLLSELHHQILLELFGDQLLLCEIPRTLKKGVSSFGHALAGHIDGLNTDTISKALQMVRNNDVATVFINGSNFGGFVKLAKRQFPQLKICVFFHNVEAKFFLGALRQSRTPRALAVLVANYLAERKATRYSDIRICMSERDSRLLQTLYGHSATHIVPMAMRDSMPRDFDCLPAQSNGKYALFVGGNFYANRSGILWFVEHVAPRIACKTVIVGRGLDDLRSQLEIGGNVVVAGAVDNLASWYRNARFVIAPIFDGSGMKTKVAEALMFGKKIIGTPEAFSGYEDVVRRAGWLCETADDFVAAIEEAQDSIVMPCDPELRAMYEQRYSCAAARSRFAEILGVGAGA